MLCLVLCTGRVVALVVYCRVYTLLVIFVDCNLKHDSLSFLVNSLHLTSATAINLSMPPILRSGTTTHGRTGVETTPTKSPRKVPHCTKCQRPRAGHPRQGCPYIPSPDSRVQPNHLDITASMSSLAISPTKSKLGERRRRPPAQEMSLASLSTESSHILHRLLEPENTRDRLSFLDKNVDTSHSSEFHRNPGSSKLLFKDGKIMPGTLVTPHPSFVTEVPPSEDIPQSDGDQLDSKASVIMPLLGVAAAPLARSMSMEERMTFLDGLAELSRGPPAAVYAIHVRELQQIAESAAKLGFHTGTVPPKTCFEQEGLLILGRDFGAVKDLLARLSGDGAPQSSSVRAMAGGAIAGAVATFTGLALA